MELKEYYKITGEPLIRSDIGATFILVVPDRRYANAINFLSSCRMGLAISLISNVKEKVCFEQYC